MPDNNASVVDPIYVLEGPETGWKFFETYEEYAKYLEHLKKADYDFVINPNW